MKRKLRCWASWGAAACCAAVSARAAPVEPVRSLVQKEKPAVIETLGQLVGIESASRDKEGLDRIAELIRGRLAALGGKVELVEPGADAVELFDTPPQIGKAVVARFEGSGTRSVNAAVLRWRRRRGRARWPRKPRRSTRSWGNRWGSTNRERAPAPTRLSRRSRESPPW